MIYKCTTPGCLLAESNAPFAAAINCPVCQQALVAETIEVKVSEKEMDLITALPYVIAYPLKRTLEEQNYWKKINYFKDTFQNYLKYLGLLTASEFFNSQLTNRRMVEAFQKNLAQPSFGSWNAFIRECIAFLKEQQHEFFCPELVAYYEKIETGNKRKIYKGDIEYIDSNGDAQLKKQEATAIGMLINFRNRFLGHGLTLEEDDSKTLWEEYYPIFKALLEEIDFVKSYPMYKREHGETYLLQGVELELLAKYSGNNGSIWIENQEGKSFEILPFYIVPGALAIPKEAKEQVLAYESFTGKTIKFFSPEGTEKLTSGSILEKLNLLLRSKKEESPYSPEKFTKELFEIRIAEENKIQLSTLIQEKKVIEGIYQHRETIEIKLREWIGARANIFFIAAEAGSGKTNLLVEIQKQYTERKLPSLFIRAARMEKTSLKEQIAYQLNLDPIIDFKEYTSIAGTQAEPTFILIDGLNEASNAEAIWSEVLEISTLFEPGSVKFVITNRANSKADLERYEVTEQQEQFIYGDRNDFEKEKGLTPYVFWLTPLDMKEMQSAWDAYVKTDTKRFKPLFEFNDLATFDRGLYLQINNPLVLRIFLETYQGKKLPEKGINHLHIWKDWFATFSENEQHFMHVLANEIWKNGANEISLDVLLNNEETKEFLQTDNISGPYPRLINLGWISRYHKEFTTFLSFTVEGLLLYLLGVKLENQRPEITVPDIHLLISEGTKLQKAAVESFLGEQALSGKIDLIAKLIDEGEDKLELCVTPLLYYLKSQGVKKTIGNLLENPTENDWKALNNLDYRLNNLQLHTIRIELLNTLIPFNNFCCKEAVLLALKSIQILDQEQEVAISYFKKIKVTNKILENDAYLLGQFGFCEKRFGYYYKALEYFEKCLEILKQIHGDQHTDVAASYSNIGSLFSQIADYGKALEYFEKCLEISLQIHGDQHSDVAASYYNIGSLLSSLAKYEKALEYFEKCLEIFLKTYGNLHSNVSTAYSGIGNIYHFKGDVDKALEFHQKSLEITIKTLGLEHPDVATSLNNIGLLWSFKCEYDKALEFYQKSLNIRLKTLGLEHPDLATLYHNIGSLWSDKCDYDKAFEFCQKSLDVKLKTLGIEHPDVAISYSSIGVIWRGKGYFDKALEFHQKSLEITIKTLGLEHPSVATSYENIGSLWADKCEFDKALKFYQKSLNIRLKTLGLEHPDVGSTYNNLGYVWFNKGEFDKSIEFYQKCLDIKLKTFGLDHPNVATSYNNIGVVLDNKGDKDNALKYYQKSLEIRLNTLGSEHSDVATLYDNIGSIWDNKGDNDNAIEFYQKSLEIRLKTLGLEHPDVADSYHNIGSLWGNKSEYDNALKFLQKSLEIRLSALGLEHPDVANSYHNIGSLWVNKGEYDNALKFYQKSLEIRSKILDKEHIDVVTSYFCIGNVLKNLYQYEKAIENFMQAFKILKKGGGIPFKIAQCYEALNNPEKALDYYIQSAEIRKEDPEVGLEAESTKESISNAKRLAKELGRENELPVWMR